MPQKLQVPDKKALREINDAWLQIKRSHDEVINPFDLLTTGDPKVFHKQLTWLMMQPEYFSFLCKHIFNIDILPMQALILREVWNRKFPMLIASRCAGKSFILSLYAMIRAFLMPGRKIVIVGAAFRQSKYLYEYMENIWRNAPVLQDLCDSSSGPRSQVDMCRMTINGSTISCLPIGDGCCRGDTLTTRKNGFYTIISESKTVWGNNKFRDIEYNIDNGIKPTKIITTKKGFSYEGTHNHAMKVLRNGKIDWVRSDQMQVGDRILIDRSQRWHDGDFDCTEDQAYALGAMIGDGCWTDKYSLSFATVDKEIITRVNKGFDNQLTQRSDDVHWSYSCQYSKADWLNFWGLKDNCYTKDKILPQNILNANQSCMSACISGLFDTDGHVFVDSSKGGTTISVNFTNTSEILVKQLQYILLHYGIVSTVSHRDRNKKWNRVYELGIYGKNVKLFAEKINFHLSRKRNKLNEAISKRKKWNSFDDDIPVTQEQVLSALNTKKINCSPAQVKRKKSFQIQFLQKVIESADVRPDWADLVNDGIFYDVVTSIEDSECHTYDIHVPDGNEYCANGFFSHNSKIRGQRANDIIGDEFASMSREIFENVIAGFAAVAANPAAAHKKIMAEIRAEELGYDPKILQNKAEKSMEISNQTVLSGTAYYDFNHFADYWKNWRKIILSKGDPTYISNNIFNGEPVPKSFNWKDYSVIRIPVDLVPTGFMDDGQIARSKATVHNGIYLMEFGAVFAKDSQGFFKRSLIESCVAKKENQIIIDNQLIRFTAKIKGDIDKRYIMGVDPASEVDNFSIIVIELNGNHRRIVHCWTTTRKDHVEKVKAGLVDDNNFYAYCARKIRTLMDLFPIEHIAMDAGGGGIAVYEALHDDKLMKRDEKGNLLEQPIWEVIDDDKNKPSDNQPGLHIIEMCQFSRYDWYSEANHGLRKDLENKVLLFPEFDTITIGLSIEEDKHNNRLYDTLEDCVLEIEDLKDELSLIEITASVNGRERWDTPEVKIGVGKKERMRKDRYSSLLMANAAARRLDHEFKQQPYHAYGGFAAKAKSTKKQNVVTFNGPSWFTDQMNGIY